jgi:hypothetical protein
MSQAYPVESNYVFSQMGRIGNDFTDATQHNIQNTAQLNNMLTNHFSTLPARGHVDFASSTRGLAVNGVQGGVGLDGTVVDDESQLWMKIGQERSVEKLQLMPRPFLTVPYLGRGSCDPIIESQLQQGDVVRGKKSVTTVMENNFFDLKEYPLEKGLADRVQDDSQQIQEAALDGWVRGGTSTRETGDKYFSKK